MFAIAFDCFLFRYFYFKKFKFLIFNVVMCLCDDILFLFYRCCKCCSQVVFKKTKFIYQLASTFGRDNFFLYLTNSVLKTQHYLVKKLQHLIKIVKECKTK